MKKWICPHLTSIVENCLILLILYSAHNVQIKEEEDERWETINNEISNALYDLEDEENLKSRLSEDNILKYS